MGAKEILVRAERGLKIFKFERPISISERLAKAIEESKYVYIDLRSRSLNRPGVFKDRNHSINCFLLSRDIETNPGPPIVEPQTEQSSHHSAKVISPYLGDNV